MEFDGFESNPCSCSTPEKKCQQENQQTSSYSQENQEDQPFKKTMVYCEENQALLQNSLVTFRYPYPPVGFFFFWSFFLLIF